MSQPSSSQPHKDRQTIDAQGRRTAPLIAGLDIRHTPPIEDHRGHVVEMFRDSWGFHPAPLVYAYQVTLRVGSVRGWVKHALQDDRIFVSRGVMTWAFYDDRAESPTHKLLNVFTFSDQQRAIFTIPQGVYHAVKNTGEAEAVFINLPTKPYDRADPDKYRLPLKNELIPFDFTFDGPRG